jgi:hypothetical protein
MLHSMHLHEGWCCWQGRHRVPQCSILSLTCSDAVLAAQPDLQ